MLLRYTIKQEAIIRRFFTLLTLYSFALLMGAFVLQYSFGFAPCPLCVMARAVVFALMLLYLIAAFYCHTPRQCKIYCSMGLLLALGGLMITGRHVWLLHLPPELVPDCSPGFDYLMKNFPWKEAFLIMFKSSGECAGQHQSVAGLSLPTWTFLAFLGYVIANLMGMKKKGSNATLP